MLTVTKFTIQEQVNGLKGPEIDVEITAEHGFPACFKIWADNLYIGVIAEPEEKYEMSYDQRVAWMTRAIWDRLIDQSVAREEDVRGRQLVEHLVHVVLES